LIGTVLLNLLTYPAALTHTMTIYTVILVLCYVLCINLLH